MRPAHLEHVHWPRPTVGDAPAGGREGRLVEKLVFLECPYDSKKKREQERSLSGLTNVDSRAEP